MIRFTKIALLVLLILFIGFAQERLKVNINFIIEKSVSIPHFFSLTPEERLDALAPIKKQGSFDYYYSHSSIAILYTLDLAQLKILKWIVTGISVLIHLIISILILRIFQSSTTNLKILYYLSALVFAIAIACQLLGTMLNLNNQLYPITRGLMGILQTPIIAIVILIASNFFANGRHTQSN